MRENRRLNLPVVPAGASNDAPGCRDHSAPHPDEFLRGQSVWDEQFSRRGFLTTMGASLALAGVTGCSDRPNEAIVPYVDPPEQVVAGEPQFFATALTRGGYGRGVIVTSREGRPVKIEGNPDHPASLGAADAQMQAAVLDLYDPLRSNAVTHAGRPSTWGNFVQALQDQLRSHDADRGRGLCVITGSYTSPTLAAAANELAARFPEANLAASDPVAGYSTQTVRGTFGDFTDVFYDLSEADVIVAFDSDFLWDKPGSLAYARQFADRRRPSGVRPTMNRLYACESDRTITGSRADHRLAVPPSRIAELLVALAIQVGAFDPDTQTNGSTDARNGKVRIDQWKRRGFPDDLSPAEAAWLAAAATDLAAHPGRSVVISGGRQQSLSSFAHAINHKLGNIGRTVRLIDPVLAPQAITGIPTNAWGESTAGLVDGSLRTLLILGDNPFGRSSIATPFIDLLSKMSTKRGPDGRPAAFTAHLGRYANETAYVCQWHVPAQHELESWGDARAYDGSASIIQPMIAPMSGGKSPLDVMNVLLGRPDQSAYDTVRSYWQSVLSIRGEAFETWWSTALRRGVIDGTAFPIQVRPYHAPGPADFPDRRLADRLQVSIRLDYSIWDGSLFHNPWLQELPRPMSKIVWGNAALISPDTARRLGVSDGDVVRIGISPAVKDGLIEIAVQTLPGMADEVISLQYGYGVHKIVGAGDDSAFNVARGVDVSPLAIHEAFEYGVYVFPTGRKEKIVRTHNHHALAAGATADSSIDESLHPHVIATPRTAREDLKIHNRKLIRTATLEQFLKTPDFAAKMDGETDKQLYPGWDYSTGPQWGMTIDLTTCIGCNACIVACQAENNTPTVGPDQVDKQREMHWLRLDSYIDEQQRVHHQPVACMHCENAPCEYVCPVAATTHSVEGLNQMTYNRCVGTRYCSNNCPYKVRRFNFFDYTTPQPDGYKMQRNPDVTVRTRGVMEKCTYCVQRINYADRKTEIAAINAGGDTTELRRHMIGRLQTACQQTCPTNAIHFGDLTDPDAQVTRNKKDDRNYGLLVELTTKPRTTYLASITNPNPSPEAGA